MSSRMVQERVPVGYAAMRELLEPLRFYDLSGGSVVTAELRAYGAALERFLARSRETLDDLFPQTCSLQRLARWERLLDLPVDRTDEASRRAMVLAKLSIGEGDFTVEGMRRSVLAAGLSASIREDWEAGVLSLYDAEIIGGYQTLDEVKRQVLKMLPDHLEAEFDIGVLTWEMFEGFGLDFSGWDARDFTWEWFDLNGEKLGGRENAKQW